MFIIDLLVFVGSVLVYVGGLLFHCLAAVAATVAVCFCAMCSFTSFCQMRGLNEDRGLGRGALFGSLAGFALWVYTASTTGLGTAFYATLGLCAINLFLAGVFFFLTPIRMSAEDAENY
jgi:hypothetical protein